MIDAEFVGAGTWIGLAEGLVAQGQLSPQDADQVRLLHLFGGLIANGDMHLGNLSFYTEDRHFFRLAPVYDMLPMALRPSG